MVSNSINLWFVLFATTVLIVALILRRSRLKRQSRVLATEPIDEAPEPDTPIPFGYKCAWYSVPTSDSDRLAEQIGLTKQRGANWQEGISSAYEDEVFVSPPVDGWIFVVGTALVAVQTEMLPTKVRRILVDLSSEFGTACFFATHRVVELHVWAKASDGIIQRAFGYLGETGEVIWDEGAVTDREADLHSGVNEEAVMKTAREWSMAPVDLDEASAEPAVGILGVV